MDEKLQQLEQELSKIAVPKEQLEQAHSHAVQKYRIQRRRRKKVVQVVMIAALFSLIFTVSVRLSPAFAQTIAKIPGFAPLVEMIAFDKGMEDIIQNDYAEEIGITQNVNNLTITILSAVADESGLLLTYRLEAPFDVSTIRFEEIQLQQLGETLPASIAYSDSPSNENVIEGNFDFIFLEDATLNGDEFELFIQLNDADQTEFTIPFKLSKPLAKSKHYTLNEQVEVDGQLIIVNQVTISPLRAEIEFTIPETNSMRILDFNTVKLIDEKGEEWGRGRSGISALGSLRDNHYTMFIESNYFREPKSLTLIIDKIEALEKGKDFIEVDFEKRKVLSVPKELDVQLEIWTDYTISATYNVAQENHVKDLFTYLIDANGEEVSRSTSTNKSSEESYQVSGSYTFEKGFVNPVKLYIANYPQFLDGHIEVKIPLN
ncbi:DUF4179 domain-containing protein [Solibacillus sp. CAU 1738]|uniref:DUF4179 domain-containing protein n=1 Tax=Solibacillus sp. CAU 1738 TaxID=3140363 RepID=UPI003260F6A5